MEKNMKKIATILTLLTIGSASVFAREAKISVTTGESWKGSHLPQFAIWLEDTDGNYLKTLYVTKKASKRSWIFAPNEGRPESLPVWYHASKHEVAKPNKKNKSAENKTLDAVTSATPKTGIIFETEIPDSSCIIKAEFNKSFDYNETFTKENSIDNGQPSLIYEATIPENETEEIKLVFEGTGSVYGSDGEIHKNTEGLTSANALVKDTKITFTSKN